MPGLPEGTVAGVLFLTPDEANQLLHKARVFRRQSQKCRAVHGSSAGILVRSMLRARSHHR
jgi:hypothetical protein